LARRRGIREAQYDNRYTAPPPLVERWLRLPVTERVDATGAVLTPLDPADLDAALDTLRGAGVEAVAICFMHAWANAAHEQAAEARARAALPAAYLSRSSALLPQVRFTERVSTTVLNAAVGPVLSRYLDRLITRLGAAGFRGVLLVMQSNGRVAPPAVARTAPAAAPSAGSTTAGCCGWDRRARAPPPVPRATAATARGPRAPTPTSCSGISHPRASSAAAFPSTKPPRAPPSPRWPRRSAAAWRRPPPAWWR